MFFLVGDGDDDIHKAPFESTADVGDGAGGGADKDPSWSGFIFAYRFADFYDVAYFFEEREAQCVERGEVEGNL